MLNGWKCSFKTNEALEKFVKYVEIHFVFFVFFTDILPSAVLCHCTKNEVFPKGFLQLK